MAAKPTPALGRAIYASAGAISVFEYINTMKNSNFKQIMKRRAREYLPDSKIVERLESVSEKYFILVFSAEWSADCRAHLTSLAKLLMVVRNSNLVVRVLDYDENRDLAEEIGALEVPTIIVHDRAWRELGRLVVRTQRGTTLEEEVWKIIDQDTRNVRAQSTVMDASAGDHAL